MRKGEGKDARALTAPQDRHGRVGVGWGGTRKIEPAPDAPLPLPLKRRGIESDEWRTGSRIGESRIPLVIFVEPAEIQRKQKEGRQAGPALYT